MRFQIFIAILLLSQISCVQTDSSIYIKKIGWTIKVPKGFKIDDSATMTLNKSRGRKLFENTLNKKINDSALETLISITKDHFNHMISELDNSNLINKQNWELSDKTSKGTLLKSLQNLLTNVQIDTLNTIDTIAGVKFKRLQMVFKLPNDMIMFYNQLNTFYNNHSWGITYIYSDKDAGTEIEKALKSSILDK